MCNKRLKYIDIARGISMLCIILGHLESSNINRVVFTFHVPVFFLITGYFISDRLSNRDFINKKIRTLLIPYFLTCAVITVLGTIKDYILYGASEALGTFIGWVYASLYGAGDSYTKPFYIIQIGAIWFLWATFWGSIFLKLSLKMKENIRICYITALFLFGCFSTKWFWFPFSIQAGCCATVFMYVGYIFKTVKPKLETVSSEAKNAFLLFSIAVWILFIKDFQGYWLVHCYFGRGIVDIISSICACWVIFQLSKLIEKVKYISDWLAYIGKYSIFVLCIHIVELNLFPWNVVVNKLYEYGIPQIFILLCIIIAKFILDITFAILASRITFVRNLFGMK